MNMFMKKITVLSLVVLCALTPMQARAGFWTKSFAVAAVGITAYFCLKAAWNYINEKKEVIFRIVHVNQDDKDVVNELKKFLLSATDLRSKISDFEQAGYKVTPLKNTSEVYKAYEVKKVVSQNKTEKNVDSFTTIKKDSDKSKKDIFDYSELEGVGRFFDKQEQIVRNPNIHLIIASLQNAGLDI